MKRQGQCGPDKARRKPYTMKKKKATQDGIQALALADNGIDNDVLWTDEGLDHTPTSNHPLFLPPRHPEAFQSRIPGARIITVPVYAAGMRLDVPPLMPWHCRVTATDCEPPPRGGDKKPRKRRTCKNCKRENCKGAHGVRGGSENCEYKN